MSFCVVSLVLFTNFIISPIDRYDYGYKMMYVVAVAICINVMILIASIIWSIYKTIRNMYRKRAWKKATAEYEVRRAKRADELKKKQAIRK